jgi:hypothetical protein
VTEIVGWEGSGWGVEGVEEWKIFFNALRTAGYGRIYGRRLEEQTCGVNPRHVSQTGTAQEEVYILKHAFPLKNTDHVTYTGIHST